MTPQAQRGAGAARRQAAGRFLNVDVHMLEANLKLEVT